jgi:hypothetical protein
VSEEGIGVILAKLEAMEREHAADMEAIGVRINLLTETHRKCAAHCWVGNQDQIREALLKGR